MTPERWPLPYDDWKDTYATLHMWSQIVGKIALARIAPINHSWSIALDVTARGLTTRTLPHGDRSFRVAFDFIDHQLVIETSDGDRRTLPLAPRSVAEYYREVMATLRDMALPAQIWPMPVDIPNPIRFTEDTVHRSYDAAFANRFWRILGKIQRTLTASSCGFIGKCSPMHLFWNSFDQPNCFSAAGPRARLFSSDVVCFQASLAMIAPSGNGSVPARNAFIATSLPSLARMSLTGAPTVAMEIKGQSL